MTHPTAVILRSVSRRVHGVHGRCESPLLTAVSPFGSLGVGPSDVVASAAFGALSASWRWVAVVALGAVTPRVLLLLVAGRWALHVFLRTAPLYSTQSALAMHTGPNERHNKWILYS